MPETTERQALRDAVRGLVAAHQAAHGSEDYDLSLWHRLGREIGVAGLAIPERFGGAGAGPVEIGVVQEELGRALAGTPMLGSAVLATRALLGSADEAACARLLPGLADGSDVAALAWTPAAGGWDPEMVACRACPASLDWIVSGDARFVLDGDVATVLIVAAETGDGVGLFEVGPDQPGVTRSTETTMDQTRRMARISFAEAIGRRIGGQANLAPVRDFACVALAAEQAGAAARALEITVEYTSTRVQFGRPIGSFQALQHRMADLYVLVESALSVSQAAAHAAENDREVAVMKAATAKIYCSEALLAVAAEKLQLHGAIAMTWEHPAHRYFKRAHGTAMLLGSPSAHLERIAAAIVDSPAAAH